MLKQSSGRKHPFERGYTMPDRSSALQIHRLRRLRRAELPVNTVKLARFLIGKTLVYELPGGRISGRIVETEAYPPGDPAGHAFTGQSRANNSLFLAHGTAYVRFTYGVHWLFNISSEIHGVGGGVLIRALEPLEGISLMRRHRGVSRVLDLARGPGRLAAALFIDDRLDGMDLCSRKSPIWIGSAVRPAGTIGVTKRIGISRAAHRRFRFYERANPFVSGPLSLRT
jgi:DNA-3-methyladenine glycosylase